MNLIEFKSESKTIFEYLIDYNKFLKKKTPDG